MKRKAVRGPLLKLRDSSGVGTPFCLTYPFPLFFGEDVLVQTDDVFFPLCPFGVLVSCWYGAWLWHNDFFFRF